MILSIWGVADPVIQYGKYSVGTLTYQIWCKWDVAYAQDSNTPLLYMRKIIDPVNLDRTLSDITFRVSRHALISNLV